MTRFGQTLDTDNILTNIRHAINFTAKAEWRTNLGHTLDKNLSKVCPTCEITGQINILIRVQCRQILTKLRHLSQNFDENWTWTDI